MKFLGVMLILFGIYWISNTLESQVNGTYNLSYKDRMEIQIHKAEMLRLQQLRDLEKQNKLKGKMIDSIDIISQSTLDTYNIHCRISGEKYDEQYIQKKIAYERKVLNDNLNGIK